MVWNLPNQLTVGRIALSAVFFVLLGLYEPAATWGPGLLIAAFVIYIIAGITDVLDGYLARKMNATSAFGRIADPFVDKVLAVGAFVMLTGSNFALHAGTPVFELRLPHWITGHMASGVQAWMVVVILGREFIVSAVRGYSESQGVKFPATPAGKIKMLVQSVAICTALYQTALLSQARWAVIVKLVMMWLAVVVTVLSGLAYVGRSRRLLGGGDAAEGS
ncbi:MAG TPA: CDP-alcohol phosphatidyltransferase family protein [Phycisphaerae bacterium]|nr:CDP-alcohol phosphatidyltransferase family protein [Phycisphaerae bacterium]